MVDYISVIRDESQRFIRAIARIDADVRVPSCPEWSAADLLWHLTEVQEFWGAIVGDLLGDPADATVSDRPEDADLPSVFGEMSARLVDVLAAREANDACWSWHPAGGTVGWVRRRQAHEALIHRVDAELTAAMPTDIDQELAADGVDEILTLFLDAVDLPGWSEFVADGTTVAIDIEGGRRWALELGRFTGTSPSSGTTYDEEAVRILDGDPVTTATISGSASALDLWLWGRGGVGGLAIDGPPDVATRIREAAAAGTQ